MPHVARSGVRPTARKCVDVVLCERFDRKGVRENGKRAVAVEVGVRNARFVSVTRSKSTFVDGDSEAEARIFDRAQGYKDRRGGP